jgi:hypothetical protein
MPCTSWYKVLARGCDDQARVGLIRLVDDCVPFRRKAYMVKSATGATITTWACAGGANQGSGLAQRGRADGLWLARGENPTRVWTAVPAGGATTRSPLLAIQDQGLQPLATAGGVAPPERWACRGCGIAAPVCCHELRAKMKGPLRAPTGSDNRSGRSSEMDE